MNLEQMSKDELLAELRRLLEREQNAEKAHDRVVHDLRVHQVELELQNRSLREAQDALEESRNRFEELYDFAPVAYFTLDDKGRVLEANLTGATMVGTDRAKIIGKPLLTLVKMPDQADFWQHLRRCGQERKAVVSELRFSTARRDLRHIQAVSVPVFDASGTPTAFRTSFTDSATP